jgi:hypothetical protein
MAFFICIWTPRAIDKCAQHGVSQDDFEHIMANPGFAGPGDGTYLTKTGYSEDGRMIRCVYEPIDETQILPMTAFEPSERI